MMKILSETRYLVDDIKKIKDNYGRVISAFRYVWSKEPVEKGDLLQWFDESTGMVALADGEKICGVAFHNFSGLGWMQTFGQINVKHTTMEESILKEVLRLVGR